MLTLSTASIIEKNKIATDGVWLMLLDITYGSEDTIRLVRNTEKITFQGNEYFPYGFELNEITESPNELPNVQLQISNATGTLQRMLEEFSGVTGANVIIRVVNTNVADVAEIEEHFTVLGSSSDRSYITFTLGTDFSFSKRFPPVRVMKDFCPFKFKSVECGYTGELTACNKTLSNCRTRNNSTRFGGEPTIPQGGLYASNS